jgi:hypothetical protein
MGQQQLAATTYDGDTMLSAFSFGFSATSQHYFSL